MSSNKASTCEYLVMADFYGTRCVDIPVSRNRKSSGMQIFAT